MMDFDYVDDEENDERDGNSEQENRDVVGRLTWRGVVYDLYEGDNFVGRDQACEVCIDHQSVSSKHATISIRRGYATVTDLRSVNGTSLETTPNSNVFHKLTRQDNLRHLQDGAKLRFGMICCEFAFLSDEEDLAQRPGQHADIETQIVSTHGINDMETQMLPETAASESDDDKDKHNRHESDDIAEKQPRFAAPRHLPEDIATVVDPATQVFLDQEEERIHSHDIASAVRPLNTETSTDSSTMRDDSVQSFVGSSRSAQMTSTAGRGVVAIRSSARVLVTTGQHHSPATSSELPTQHDSDLLRSSLLSSQHALHIQPNAVDNDELSVVEEEDEAEMEGESRIHGAEDDEDEEDMSQDLMKVEEGDEEADWIAGKEPSNEALTTTASFKGKSSSSSSSNGTTGSVARRFLAEEDTDDEEELAASKETHSNNTPHTPQPDPTAISSTGDISATLTTPANPSITPVDAPTSKGSGKRVVRFIAPSPSVTMDTEASNILASPAESMTRRGKRGAKALLDDSSSNAPSPSATAVAVRSKRARNGDLVVASDSEDNTVLNPIADGIAKGADADVQHSAVKRPRRGSIQATSASDINATETGSAATDVSSRQEPPTSSSALSDAPVTNSAVKRGRKAPITATSAAATSLTPGNTRATRRHVNALKEEVVDEATHMAPEGDVTGDVDVKKVSNTKKSGGRKRGSAAIDPNPVEVNPTDDIPMNTAVASDNVESARMDDTHDVDKMRQPQEMNTSDVPPTTSPQPLVDQRKRSCRSIETSAVSAVTSSSASRSTTTTRSDADDDAIVLLFTKLEASEFRRELRALPSITVTTDASLATHIVTTAELKRTPKLMVALNAGRVRYVLQDDWLSDSAKQGHPLPIVPASALQSTPTSYEKALSKSKYLVQDREKEELWGFRLVETLTRLRFAQSPSNVFGGIVVYVTKGVCGVSAPSEEDLQSIVVSGGGLLCLRWEDALQALAIDPSAPHGKSDANGMVATSSSSSSGAGGRASRKSKVIAPSAIPPAETASVHRHDTRYPDGDQPLQRRHLVIVSHGSVVRKEVRREHLEHLRQLNNTSSSGSRADRNASRDLVCRGVHSIEVLFRAVLRQELDLTRDLLENYSLE